MQNKEKVARKPNIVLAAALIGLCGGASPKSIQKTTINQDDGCADAPLDEEIGRLRFVHKAGRFTRGRSTSGAGRVVIKLVCNNLSSFLSELHFVDLVEKSVHGL